MYIRGIFCALTLFLICSNHASFSSEDQIKLSLQDCISLAMKSNIDIQIQRIGPQIQAEVIKMAKGRFDPTVSLGPSFNSSEEPTFAPTGAEALSSSSRSINLSISDPVVTGGRYGLSLNGGRSKSSSGRETFNPAYRSGLAFTVSQPLLESFGIRVNRASEDIARNNQKISFLRLKSQLIRTLSDVQDAYWELVFALENLKVQQLALKQAQDLLYINQRRKEVGKATASDVLQAQAAVASREADVIAAKDAVKDAEDKLKHVTNLIQDAPGWDAEIIPVDTPAIEDISVNLQESIAKALENRPEYLQLKLDLQNSDISIKVAKNGLLPELDLEGSYALNGLGGNLDEPFSQVGRIDYPSWYIGLVLRMPLGGRAESAELKKNLLEKEQKLLSLKDMEQQIIAEVRGAVRQLETDRKRIEATKTSEEFARQVLSAEEQKHKLGLSTSYEILQFQANLATASKNHLRAVIDYRKSIVSFYQSTGVTLEKLNIELKEHSL